MVELVRGKITKARIAVVEEDLTEIIEQQNKPSYDVTVNKVAEIIYAFKYCYKLP